MSSYLPSYVMPTFVSNVSGGSCSVQVVYDDTGHAPLVNPKQVQDVLVKCFIHEVRFVVWLNAGVLLG